MLFEDDHYCLKCGETIAGIDNYVAHRSRDCSVVTPKNIIEIPTNPEDTPTEQFFSVLQLQRRSDVPAVEKSNKGMRTRSKTRSKFSFVEPRTFGPAKKRKRAVPQKPKKDVEKKAEERLNAVHIKEDEDVWLVGQDRRRTDSQQGRSMSSEVFPMSPMYMPDLPEERDAEVDKFLHEDYDPYYQFMAIEDMHYDHSRIDIKGGGKGSPTPWPWDSIVEESHKNCPPSSHTGGKWKPPEGGGKSKPVHDAEGKSIMSPDGGRSPLIHPPEFHTGGKWRIPYPPESHTGGKWKAPDSQENSKTVACVGSNKPKLSNNNCPPVDHTRGKWKAPESDEVEKPLSVSGTTKPATPSNPSLTQWPPDSSAPPPEHTKGKWKAPEVEASQKAPSPPAKTKAKVIRNTGSKSWTAGDPMAPPVEHTRGKWVPVTAAPAKCLKTSGGSVQYHCSPCGRHLASKEMYKRHLRSDLHVKRLLQETDLECDGRSSRPLNELCKNDTRVGKRVVKLPSRYRDGINEEIELKNEEDDAKKTKKKVRCDACGSKILKGRLGKHLVSYYHYRRANLNQTAHREQILTNIEAVIRQSPYQCSPCHFYCNTPARFKEHWKENHTSMIQDIAGREYWCSFCKFRCRKGVSMYNHLDSKEHQTVIKVINRSMPIIIRQPLEIICKICKKDFFTNFNLKLHEVKHHGFPKKKIGPLPCPLCEFIGTSKKSVQMHLKHVHKKINGHFFCSACNLSFPSARDALQHRGTSEHRSKSIIATGTPEQKASLSRTCLTCNEVFSDSVVLLNHVLKEHPDKKHFCDGCGKDFPTPQLVNRHTRMGECEFPKETVDSTKSKYSCKQCAFTCEWEAVYLFHISLHSEKTPEGLLPCAVCQKPFTRHFLRRHVVMHSNERKYTCELCGKSYRWAHHVRMHQERYCPRKKEDSGIKKEKKVLECEECWYTATSSQQLTRHMIKHSGKRAFPCSSCSFSALSHEHLKRHMVIHSGLKPYKCPYCDYVCNLFENLRKHILITGKHTGKRMYQCWLCQFSTNSFTTFKSHLRVEHFELALTDTAVRNKIRELFENKDIDSTPKHETKERKPRVITKKPEEDLFRVVRPSILRPIVKIEPVESPEEVEEEDSSEVFIITDGSPADFLQSQARGTKIITISESTVENEEDSVGDLVLRSLNEPSTTYETVYELGEITGTSRNSNLYLERTKDNEYIVVCG